MTNMTAAVAALVNRSDTPVGPRPPLVIKHLPELERQDSEYMASTTTCDICSCHVSRCTTTVGCCV